MLMPTELTRYGRDYERGFSLYTLLAAVVVLGVVTATLVSNFSGENSKGQALFLRMQTIGASATQYRSDSGCYPTDLRALWSYAHGRSKNSCGMTIDESRWHGPYMLEDTVGSFGGMHVDGYGPKTTLKLDDDSDGYFVSAENLPPELAKAVYEACGGSGSSCEATRLNGFRHMATVSYYY